MPKWIEFYSHVNYSVTKMFVPYKLADSWFYSHVNYSVTKIKCEWFRDGVSFTVT